jgi:hypothetical protein
MLGGWHLAARAVALAARAKMPWHSPAKSLIKGMQILIQVREIPVSNRLEGCA